MPEIRNYGEADPTGVLAADGCCTGARRHTFRRGELHHVLGAASADYTGCIATADGHTGSGACADRKRGITDSGAANLADPNRYRQPAARDANIGGSAARDRPSGSGMPATAAWVGGAYCAIQ